MHTIHTKTSTHASMRIHALDNEQLFIDKRSLLRKAFHATMAPFRDISFVVKTVPSRILTAFNRWPHKEYCLPKKVETWNQWKNDSSGLHVFTHGYRGHPSIWDIYIKALSKNEPSADLRVPFVPKRGNCSLEKATQAIRLMVKSYLDEQIEKRQNTVIPLTLYGVSNGARIVFHVLDGLITDELNDRLKSKGLHLAIKINAIAGVLNGTTHWKIRYFNRSRLTKWIACKLLRTANEILEDFQYQSTSGTKLISFAKKITNRSNITFKFSFFASTEDPLVIPRSSSLPLLGKGETHHIVHGEGHSSIVKRVFPIILEEDHAWKTSQAKVWQEYLHIQKE